MESVVKISRLKVSTDLLLQSCSSDSPSSWFDKLVTCENGLTLNMSEGRQYELNVAFPRFPT